MNVYLVNLVQDALSRSIEDTDEDLELNTVLKILVIFETIKVFLNPFAKPLAKILPITVCDGIINL